MKFSHKVVCIKDFKDTSLEKELTYGKVYMVNDLYKLKNYSQLKAPKGEQEMIFWFIKTIDDSIKKSKQN